MIQAGHRLPAKGASIHINTLKTLPTPAGYPNVWEAQFYYAEGEIAPADCPNRDASAQAAADQVRDAGGSAKEAEARAAEVAAAHVLADDPETGWPMCTACDWRFCQPGQRPQAFDGSIKDAVRVPADTADEAVVERIRAKVAERQAADQRRTDLAQLVVLDAATAMRDAVEGDLLHVTDAKGQVVTWRHVRFTRLRRPDEWAPLEATEDELYLPVDAPVDEAHEYLAVATMEATKADEAEAAEAAA